MTVQEGALLQVLKGETNTGPASDRAELFWKEEFWYVGRTKLFKYVQNCKLHTVAILQGLFLTWRLFILLA